MPAPVDDGRSVADLASAFFATLMRGAGVRVGPYRRAYDASVRGRETVRRAEEVLAFDPFGKDAEPPAGPERS